MTLPAVAPSVSTQSMSLDRKYVGKLVGHLYVAAKTLIEGHVSSMEEVRHEIRAIMYAGRAKKLSNATDDSVGSGTSLAAFRKVITQLLMSLKDFPEDTESLPDDFKQDLARAIKQGKKLCSGRGSVTMEALSQIKQANLLYNKLSGASYAEGGEG